MRERLLEGKLDFPGTALFEAYPDSVEEIKKFWGAVWYNFLNDNETNGVHWYERLGMTVYNEATRRLSHNGWIVARAMPARRWLSVSLVADKLLENVTTDELQGIKAAYKYDKYKMKLKTSTLNDVVKQNGKKRKTGLVRNGMMDAGNTQFGYDTEMIKKYRKYIELNVTKSMDKIRKFYPNMVSSTSSYDSVSVGILQHHIDNPDEIVSPGDNLIDSRGRGITSATSNPFNPFGNKDARSLMVITYPKK